ncbi:hypothetical protein JRO89_XS05G0016400 [Xanthoceras sorbifolium]|uniref:tRNA(adenine(34)) deaminase n=1 Tax=Xanthoceras sorbifolium TaxID=99658 RepID=A0ABQ8HZX7_9ROSI|nr:hypothetical protein JRO89_XS05G0016400 [Xanthoceras sorbifolium]
MHNSYFSSTLASLKSNGSFSFSFNDYSSLLNDRFDRTSSSSSTTCSCCSCCCCCAFATHNRLPIHPSYLYGLRQSTLIQCSPSRRLILGVGDRYLCRFPVCDLDGGIYGVSCSIKKTNGNGGFDRRRKGRFRCMVSEEKSESCQFGDFNDAEAVISLLSEEFSEEYLGGTGRNEKLAKRVEVEKRHDCGREFYRGKKNKVEVVKRENCAHEFHRGKKTKVQVEKRENYGGDCSRWRKKNVGLDLLESDSNCEFESTIQLREEGYRRNEENKALIRDENCRGRTKSSSSSSYHSFASSEEYESDKEVQGKEGEFVEESLRGFKKDSSRDEADRFKAEVKNEFGRCSDDAEGHGEVLEPKYAGAGSRVEWDCRKKSEKKLTEVATEEAQSIKESSEIHLRRDRMHETDYAKASSSRKKLSDAEKKSSLAVNSDKETKRQYDQMGVQDRKQYNQMGIQDATQSESRRKCEEVTNTAEIHVSDIEKTLQSQQQFNGREENLRMGEHHQRIGLIARNDDLRANLQQGSRTSEILDIDTERISDLQRHSESTVKVREEDTTLGKSSSQGTEEQYKRRDERIIGQIDLRPKPEHSEISVPRDTNSKKSSIVQSETRMKNQEEHTRLLSISYPEAKGQQSQIDHKHHERTQSKKGSQDLTGLSVDRTSDMNIHTESQRIAETRITNQEHTLPSVVKPIRETRGRHNQTDEKVQQTTSRKEAQKPTRLSTFVKSPEESSSLQSSSKLLSQAGAQQIYVEDERNSQAILTPPPSQLVARGSVHVDRTSGIAVQEVSSKSSESGSSTFYTHSGARTPDLHDESYGRGRRGEASDEPLELISPEDALGSAQRLEELSMQFIGEFVEKARHEVSTSEMQKEKKAAETRVIYEGEKQWQKNSGQYGSEDFQLKGQDSRQSSESYGAKGHLDLISHEDVLESAHRFEESSMHFVGEFAEKARHGVSTSEIQKEKKASEEKVVYEGEKQRQKNSGQSGSEDFQLKRRESKRSSGSSRSKGPSDEMWDVTDPSVQPAETETPKSNIAAGAAIVKKSGRSLWSIMADIVRLRWGSHAETPTSAARSDGKSSSNESISSETWFSGRESDKNSDENVKRERRSTLQEATPAHQPKLRKTSTQTQGEASDSVRSLKKVKQLEADMTSSSKGISSNFGEENFGQIADEKNFQGTASGMEIVPSSSTLPTRIIRRPSVEEISETGRTEMSESGSMEQLVQSSVSLTAVSGSAGKDGELKQRRLQRNKQVFRDRFDEWEEAYQLESDQRKCDEIFMREALLEAKKAADTWEVPVGAVLVQHGKIIARGCNLVEELRDSTAHAEMICIRVASNVLRTWRLAETTLYVTLEPCPMCAGAILQARIPTLVWGAPNKLLGADGSWVRLFPDGGEGGGSSEPSDKPPAPVHPFHPKMTIRRGVLATECAEVMQQFFQLRRRKKEKNVDSPHPPSCLPVANHPSKILTKMQNMFHMMFCL